MRVVEALREAGRDVTTGTTHALLYAAVFATTVGAVSFTGTATEVTTVERAHAWVASGAATLVQEAEGHVDGGACDALTALPAVLHAGAVRASDDVLAPAALPSETVPLHEVSAGFPAIVGQPGDGLPGLLLSRAVADAIGVDPGDGLRTTTGTVPVTSIYDHPDDGRDPALAYAALAPAAADGLAWDACWVTVWPDDDEVAPALARTLVTDGADEDAPRPTVHQLNPSLGSAFERAPAPTTRQVGAGAALVGLVVGTLTVHRRRLALASDRHVGVTRTAQVTSSAAQTLVWTTLGSGIVLTVTLWATHGLDAGDATPLVLDAGRTLLLGGLGCLAGTTTGVLLVREASLFRHVQER